MNPTSYFLYHSPNNNNITAINERHVTEGLDFILTLFEDKTISDRTISTKLTDNKQYTVRTKLEALSYFKEANYLDCRISAYKPESIAIDFLLIDHDRSDFKSKQELNKAKNETLKKISRTFKIKAKSIPVIWSGRGYHIDLPVESNGKIFEQIPKFKKFVSIFKDLNKEFLKFAEDYLSNGKCDQKHNTTVSFNNCMLRIPGSFNSKNNRQVRIIQKSIGTPKKVSAQLLYDKFFAYLQDEKHSKLSKQKFEPYAILSENVDLSHLSRHQKKSLNVVQAFMRRQYEDNKNKTQFRAWIELLLKTPISDDRKYCIWRILAPYLVNVRHLTYDESFDIIDKWVTECSELEPLDFDSEYRINEGLTRVRNFFPIGLDTLKEENRRLYNKVISLLL